MPQIHRLNATLSNEENFRYPSVFLGFSYNVKLKSVVTIFAPLCKELRADSGQLQMGVFYLDGRKWETLDRRLAF